jgi:hypothetical protein
MLKNLSISLCKSFGFCAGKRQTVRRGRLLLETLEDRLVPAGLVPAGVEPIIVLQQHTNVQPAVASSPIIYQPYQIRIAYGINGITFGSTPGDGSGQTIAIVDLDNDPNIVGDLNTFDSTYRLTASGPYLSAQYGPASSFLTVYDQNGNVINPSTTTVPVDPTGGWEGEESIDVEWAHAIAPGAKIDVIECSSNLYTGAQTAAGLPGVSVVSMSFGTPEAETSNENSLDSIFTTPSGHQPVTFLAASGDTGAPGGYPAYSPNVVAVGGTTLILNANNTIQRETGWSTGSDAGTSWQNASQLASGGGVSQTETEPSYQKGVQTTGFRTIPDVAFDADPQTGVAIIDSFGGGTVDGNGTSLATPVWAGLVAIADQSRSLSGKATLSSSSASQYQIQTALYGLPSSDFHDNLGGNNGTTTSGLVNPAIYNEITGLGSPVANLIVGGLSGYGSTTGTTDHLVVTAQPPSSITAGNAFTVAISAETASGAVDSSFQGSVTITLASNPGSGTLGGTLTVTAVKGVATFANLTISNAGSGYTLQASSSGLATVTTSSFTVTAPSTSGAVSFVLQTNGQLWEHSSSGWTFLASGIAAISNQGVDNSGRAMTDVINTSGVASEYHNGTGWVNLGSDVSTATAGHGVSYVLFATGYLDEYSDVTGAWTYIDNGVTSISAGTDKNGVNAVDLILTSGAAWEHSDSSGWHFIASGVRYVSAGQMGIADYVTTSGNAYCFAEAAGASTYLAPGVAQVTTGTDQNGNTMIDLLYANGNLYEYHASSGWAFLSGGVQSIGKGRGGLVDVVFSSGNAYEHEANGSWNFLTGSVVMAV